VVASSRTSRTLHAVEKLSVDCDVFFDALGHCDSELEFLEFLDKRLTIDQTHGWCTGPVELPDVRRL